MRGFRQGENPARWRGHLDKLLPSKAKVRTVEHHAALPYAELPAFMAELADQQGVAVRALEFAVLTAARTGEVIGATWAEIDLYAQVWIIPKERMTDRANEVRADRLTPTSAFLALSLAVDRYGDQPLAITGSETFKSALVDVAIERRVQVTFSDPDMERARHDGAVLCGKGEESPIGLSREPDKGSASEISGCRMLER